MKKQLFIILIIAISVCSAAYWWTAGQEVQQTAKKETLVLRLGHAQTWAIRAIRPQ